MLLSWLQVFRSRIPPEAIDLVGRLLEYTPSNRITANEACAHPFFDELHQPSTKMVNGHELPLLFNFTSQGNSPVCVCTCTCLCATHTCVHART